jgi:hypothetical protein
MPLPTDPAAAVMTFMAAMAIGVAVMSGAVLNRWSMRVVTAS